MCNEIVISTDAPFDLVKFNQKNVYFEQNVPDTDKINLKYPNVYRLATEAPNGCGCGFRHWGNEMAESYAYEFQDLQDWYDEEPTDNDMLNTQFIFQVIKNLVNQGYHVDSFNSWFDEMNCSPVRSAIVNVNQIDKRKFTFFYQNYFDYQK